MIIIEEAPNYKVSSTGEVWSEKSKGFLKQKTNKDGYNEVTLHVNGDRLYRKVHRLVAMAFIPNPNNLPIVHHRDGDPSNNDDSNLKWVTSKENRSESYIYFKEEDILHGQFKNGYTTRLRI